MIIIFLIQEQFLLFPAPNWKVLLTCIILNYLSLSSYPAVTAVRMETIVLLWLCTASPSVGG